jgi:hypothetical protein
MEYSVKNIAPPNFMVSSVSATWDWTLVGRPAMAGTVIAAFVLSMCAAMVATAPGFFVPWRGIRYQIELIS